jgi:hypothetical protein
MGIRRSWRGAADCKSVPLQVSRFESDYPHHGPVAQLVEHVTFNHVAVGSNPTRFTKFWGVAKR